MGIEEILYAGLFCFTMVFVLLSCLLIAVKLSTSAIKGIESRAKK